jgi:hypothetical protein
VSLELAGLGSSCLLPGSGIGDIGSIRFASTVTLHFSRNGRRRSTKSFCHASKRAPRTKPPRYLFALCRRQVRGIAPTGRWRNASGLGEMTVDGARLSVEGARDVAQGVSLAPPTPELGGLRPRQRSSSSSLHPSPYPFAECAWSWCCGDPLIVPQLFSRSPPRTHLRRLQPLLRTGVQPETDAAHPSDSNAARHFAARRFGHCAAR